MEKKQFGTLLSIMILGTLCPLIMGCPPSHPPARRHYYLTNLPDSRKLNTLAFIGTHDSATSGVVLKRAQTQWMTIAEQLDAGIRVFDMRVRLYDNEFMMNHAFVYLGMSFGYLMNNIRNFLKNHPKEMIIMFMQKEYKSYNTDKSECEILRSKYMKEYPDLFVENWSVHDTLKEHRGKILLATAHRGFWECTKSLPCREQNNWEISSNYLRNHKWADIKALQDEMFHAKRDNDCYINYLSGNGFGFEDPESLAINNIPNPFNLSNPALGPGMNDRMYSYFRNPKNATYIVMADYPNEDLIEKIILSN